MKEIDIVKIHKKLSRKLDEERYMHTLGVEFTACSLAMKYGIDKDKARLAGLLHDCAKAYDSSEYLDICAKYNISVNEAEKKNPGLLHAKLGGFFTMKKYHVTDGEIVDAIICHTTGKPDMNLLEKIIYISDYIEPGRDILKLPRIDEIRMTAFTDIDSALFMILEDTMKHLKNSGHVIDPMTEKTYLYYKEKEINR
ncbi:MAG: bis(5'-nucleosyl)-tetraphosphatase (symmetrical) YqeK [Lachnospiraceae bacterium]|nr:bis(5'-nucleosyl)-tetraphosphatase (symmetrical) YqeK [Lachnospiraceae bacterium]